jgi:hypothetical protein
MYSGPVRIQNEKNKREGVCEREREREKKNERNPISRGQLGLASHSRVY